MRLLSLDRSLIFFTPIHVKAHYYCFLCRMEWLGISIWEWAGVVLNVLYLVLLIRRSIWCWPFGILGSGLSIYLFIESKLYSEAILYGFYVLIGVYGWIKWSRNADENDLVQPILWSLQKHLVAIAIGIAATFGLGHFFQTYTDAERPMLDAFSTGFAFVASFLEAQQVLSGWIYWIILNGFSVWLYYDRGLELYGLLSVVYTVMSFVGYYQWQKIYQKGKSFSADPNILD